MFPIRPRGKSLNLMALATMIAAAGASRGPVASDLLEPVRRRARWNRYTPHQSDRECARRRGGAAWAAFKRADRARRGLEA